MMLLLGAPLLLALIVTLALLPPWGWLLLGSLVVYAHRKGT